MKNEKQYIQLLNKDILDLFFKAIKITLFNTHQFWYFIKSVFYQRKALKIRRYWNRNGFHVPPFMIFSITHQCNLNCKGCYAIYQKRKSKDELTKKDFIKVLKEAQELGISIVLLSGGEPFIRNDLIEVISQFKNIIFIIFTNGSLLDEYRIKKIKKNPHIIPVISIEGDERLTNLRRGDGVFNNLMSIFNKLKKNRIFFGTSLTITKKNIDAILNLDYIKTFTQLKCRLFFFIEYIPFQKGTENLVVEAFQREKIKQITYSMQKQFPALFVAFPGDEEKYGGCLAAGRGFIHINAQGDIEPCPFSPFSDINIKKDSLKKALQSKLLSTIRSHPEQLDETAGGCTLWQKRDWVQSLLKK